MINPYSGVTWGTVTRVMSCSHEHCENQTQFNRLTEASGLRHFAISNYYPSVPVYPLSDASFITYGIPENAISCPNAEHHNFSITDLHMNGLGSFFESGSPRGESPFGVNLATPEEIIPQIISQLQYEDGGGVTINHPTWSNLSVPTILQILDIDNRVLGIEIFNSFIGPQDGGWDGETVPHIEDMASNIAKWDAVLATGRRCWGFCVADHQGQQYTDWMGRNILLVDEATEHKCLQAYRKGSFYGQLKNSNLAFNNVAFSNGTFTVNTANANKINIIIDGVATEHEGNSASVNVPINATYVRAEGHSDDDIVFTNPIILKEYVPKPDSITKTILLFMS